MMVTALGAAVSDGLEDGRVVSGVGGQYNFVDMSNTLDNARSALMFRAVRDDAGKAASNVRWNYGHTTIPRHLRDLYVNEYGIADLRGKMREKYGEKVKLRVVAQQKGWLQRRFGLDGRAPHWSQDVIGALDERALWARYGL